MKKHLLANSNYGVWGLRNKAFTLVELLAIIVIIAIIAVITVPIILNVIENSRKGAAVDSTYLYKESVHQFYVSKYMASKNEDAPSGYKKVSNLVSDGFVVSGESPTDGWVKLSEGQVIDYSLKFGNYVVSYDKTTSSPVAVYNGEIGPMPSVKLYSESNNVLTKKDKSQMAAGDIVVLETDTLQEKFIVLNDATHIDPMAPAGTTALLAVNNLNVGLEMDSSLPEGFQGKEGYYPVAFAGSQYWQSYATNIYDPEKNYSAGTDYSVAYYVNNYVTNLINAGFTCVDSGRILTYSEVRTDTNPVGIASSDALIISGKAYWLSSADYNDRVWFVSRNGGTSSMIYKKLSDFGVRPLIYINTSDIE